MRFTLRNRPERERRVLFVLRGASLERLPRSRQGETGTLPKAEHLRCFAHLRDLARAQGLSIQPADCRFVHEGELRLLSWLAQAQRVAGFSDLSAEPDLRAAILRCAGLLDGMGLRLAPFTLYGTRLRGADRGGIRARA